MQNHSVKMHINKWTKMCCFEQVVFILYCVHTYIQIHIISLAVRQNIIISQSRYWFNTGVRCESQNWLQLFAASSKLAATELNGWLQSVFEAGSNYMFYNMLLDLQLTTTYQYEKGCDITNNWS